MLWLDLNMSPNVMVAVYQEGEVLNALVKLDIPVDESRDELTGHCPMHRERTGKEDSNPSWSVNQSTGVHHCFSCGYRGTLLGLIAEVKDFKTSFGLLDYEAAKDWLSSNTDIDLDALKQSLENAKDSYIRVPRPIPMSEARLAVYSEPPQWALDARGITAEDCKKYSVKWDNEKSIWILPLRYPENNLLMGWQEKGQGNRHFFNRPTGIQKSKTLFGIDAWEGGTMVVVESPLDAVKCGGVALCGTSVSQAQVDLMKKADKLIIAFDNPKIDAAGEKAAKEFLNMAGSSGLECWFFSYGESGVKDIGDMTPEQLATGIERAKHFVFGKEAVYG